jgi:hypothetical protein
MALDCSLGPRNVNLLVLVQNEAVQGEKASQGKAHYLEASFTLQPARTIHSVCLVLQIVQNAHSLVSANISSTGQIARYLSLLCINLTRPFNDCHRACHHYQIAYLFFKLLL